MILRGIWDIKSQGNETNDIVHIPFMERRTNKQLSPVKLLALS